MFRKISLLYKNYGQLFSLIIGILGFIFGFVQYFYPYSSKADVKYFLQESIDVVSVKQNVDALQITFNGRNIQKDSLGLKIFKIRLKNEGKSSVSQSDYAEIPFGLILKNGNLISVRHTGSNQYLKENIKPALSDSTKLLLGKCILDSKQYVDLEILVIHKLNQVPEFSAVGKIASIDKIEITIGVDDEFSWWDLIVGIGGLFLALWLFVTSLNLLEDFFHFVKKTIRRKIALHHFDFPINPLNESQRAIVNIIAEVGYKKAKPIFRSIISNDGHYDELYRVELENKNVVSSFRTLIKNEKYDLDLKSKDIEDYDSDALFIVEELKEDALLNEERQRVKDEFLAELIEFDKTWKK